MRHRSRNVFRCGAVLKESSETLIKSAGETIVREVETAKREKGEAAIEGIIRDHLRGFSRTIPSFLMAYGDENTKLENFDPDHSGKRVPGSD